MGYFCVVFIILIGVGVLVLRYGRFGVMFCVSGVFCFDFINDVVVVLVIIVIVIVIIVFLFIGFLR